MHIDIKTKKIIINGVKSAGIAVKELAGKIETENLSKVTTFDYGIPADEKAEKIILDAVHKSKLNCKIISEETGLVEKSNAEYKIFIDALDGTVNFSRGIPTFCIGLGIYSLEDEPLLGIIYDPNQDELFVGEKNQGVTLNGNKILPKTLEKNILINLEWFGADDYLDIVEKLKKDNFRARTAGSGVLALCYGVTGRGDAAILLQNSPWDVAPGMVFAKELGYIIRQIDGNEVDLNKRKQNIIAAPRVLFEKILHCLNK